LFINIDHIGEQQMTDNRRRAPAFLAAIAIAAALWAPALSIPPAQADQAISVPVIF